MSGYISRRKGFAVERLLPVFFSDISGIAEVFFGPITGVSGLHNNPGGLWLPFPTSALIVSGKKNNIIAKQAAENIVRNQNMLLQPRCSERAPPKAGPIQGASIGPRLNQPKKPPRSSTVAMSPISPAPSAIILAQPPDWTARSRRRSQNADVGHNAKPMHDPTRMRRHIRKSGLLPYLSDSGPHSIGEHPCIARYMVTVRLMSSTDRWKTVASVGIAGK